MDVYSALVFSVGSIVGGVIITQMWQMNYFKRENFKFALKNKQKEYNLNFKKLERDLGLKGSKSVSVDEPDNSVLGNVGGLLKVLKGLEPDQIGALADRFLNPEEVESGQDDLLGTLSNFAANNPEMVNGFLQGLSKKTDNAGNTQETGY